MNKQKDDTSAGDAREEGLLRGLVARLVDDLRAGSGDPDQRREVEEWLRALAEKYPEFRIESGLRDYYLAEAGRLRERFEGTPDLSERLNLGRSIEAFLERASEIERRMEPPQA